MSCTTNSCCDCPYKVGEFDMVVSRKFIHGNIFLEALRNYLRVSSSTVYLNQDNEFRASVIVFSNTDWEVS